MLKKIFIFLLISFLIFFLTLFYYHKKDQEIKQAINEVKQITSGIEIKELEKTFSEINDENTENTGNYLEEKKRKLEELIANQLVDIDYIESTGDSLQLRYKKLYISYMGKNNIYAAIKAIKKLIPLSEHKEVWQEKLADLYIKIGEFKKAEEIIQKVLRTSPSKGVLIKYLYIKFQNTNFFDKKQVKKLKSLVSLYYEKKLLSLDDLTFYNFLIQLLSFWDTEKLGVIIDSLLKDLKKPLYKNIIYSLKKDLGTYKSTKGAPLYYFKALVALDLLRYGYFGIAKNIAESVYIQDSNYILPKQILAYSYFYMGNYEQAVKYFQDLKETDKSNEQEYNFFLGISYYWLGKHEDALLYLNQVNYSYPYYLDVLRYEFLIYKKLKDTDKVIDVINEMLKYKLTYVDYYNIFKYLLFQCKDCYKNNLKTTISLIRKCYKDTEKNRQYVCWYGKANLFYKLGKIKYSIKYFEMLSKYFQDSYIYEILAKYYESQNKLKKAKFYYLKELLYTNDIHKREEIKQKIKKIIIKLNNK